jgi:putative CocE/NonD family hydrolase
VNKTIFIAAAFAAAIVGPAASFNQSQAAVQSPTATYTTSPVAPGVNCETVQVPMRDGTLLTTDLYLPQQGGVHPVILARSPYGFLLGFGCFAGLFEPSFAQFAEHGYVGVFQEVRGTYTSEGVFDPFTQELNDGYDAVEWAAAQGWSTGKVGMTSGSYLGIDQWMAAVAGPPHLYAINPDIAASDPHDNPVYENGVLRLSDILQYASDFVPDDLTREGMPQQIPSFESMYTANLPSYVETIPLESMGLYHSYPETHWYYKWVGHPNYDAYWNAQDTETHWPHITVPALIGGASDDLFNIGAIRNYQGMRAFGGSAAARTGTKLYWQAYGHAGDSGTPTFGNDDVPWTAGPSGEQLQFFDHYLKGAKNGYEQEPNAYVYVLVPPDKGETGTGFWLNADNFPLTGTTLYRFFLGSGGHANSRLGDGYLVRAVNANANAIANLQPSTSNDQFTFDPMNPVPTVGGNLLTADALTHTKGFQDQSTVELRKDVLVYTSAPLVSNMPVIGTVDASFWAITSAADTDFTVKLVDVHPDGLNNNVVDRVIRARFRFNSKLPPAFIVPNVPYQYSLQVGNTAYIFPTGHRIRVEISSSNFPKFERNLGTIQAGQHQDRYVVQHQTILHDTKHRSYIELPVAPGVKP